MYAPGPLIANETLNLRERTVTIPLAAGERFYTVYGPLVSGVRNAVADFVAPQYAPLFAVAPQLVAALRGAMRWRVADLSRLEGPEPAWVETARAALAAARGEGTMRTSGETPTHDQDCALGSGAGCDCGLVALRAQAAAAPRLVEALDALGCAVAPFIAGAIGSRNPVVCAAVEQARAALATARAALAAARGEE